MLGAFRTQGQVMVSTCPALSGMAPGTGHSLTHSPLVSATLLGSQGKAGGCYPPLSRAELGHRGNAVSFPTAASRQAPGGGCCLTAPALLLKLRLACHQYCLNKLLCRRSSRPSCGAAGKEQPGSRPSCGRSGWQACGCQWHRVPTGALPEGFPPHLWPL